MCKKDSAIVTAEQLERITPLRKYGFKLEIKPLKDGRFHVTCERVQTDP